MTIACHLNASYQSCSCTGQGLPRRRSHGCLACALTARFQPYLVAETSFAKRLRRCIFCCTFPRLGRQILFSIPEKNPHHLLPAAVSGCPLPGRFRPGVFGLSSPSRSPKRPSGRPCITPILAQKSQIVNPASSTFPQRVRRLPEIALP